LEILQNIFTHQFFAVNRIIGERYGWEAANQIIDEVAAESTGMLVDAYRRKYRLEGEGAALVSQVIQVEFQGEGSDVAVITETKDGAELDILCVMGHMLQKPKFAAIPITDGLCGGGCCGWAEELAQSVAPDLHVDRLAWMGDGAPRCRFRVSRDPEGVPDSAA
jgi:hypothetical protein